MIGIGLMAFFIAWAVLLLSSNNIPQRSLHQLSELAFGPQMVFETGTQSSSVKESSKEVFFKSTSKTPIILTGLPAYQGAVYSMPIDTRPISGYLQIDITSQVLDDVKGVFRVSINNTKRGELLLYPGVAGRSLVIPLSPSELVKERLVVSFSTLGIHASQGCTSKDGISSIVEVETTSGLFLELDRELKTPRDVVLLNGGVVPIAWNREFTHKKKVKLIRLGTEFIRKHHEVIFENIGSRNALLPASLENLKAELPEINANQFQWPYPVATRGTNFGLKRFHETANWRIKYQPHKLKHQHLPSAFDLHLALSGIQSKETWTLAVTLNGYMIHHDTIPSNQKTYRKIISLNTKDQTADNLIEVTVSSSRNNTGICNDGPVLLAQMETDSVLLESAESFDENLIDLRNKLAKISSTELIFKPNITESQVSIFSRILAAIIPESVQMNLEPSKAKLQFFQRSQFTNLVNNTNDGTQYWVGYFDEADELKVVRLMEPQNDALISSISPNAVLISIPKLRVTQ
jgi:hypothetical protein